MYRLWRVAVGWVDFWWATIHELQCCFFCPQIYAIVNAELHSRFHLLELFVVAYYAFSVDDHSRWHQPRSWAHGEIQPDFRLINWELVSLHACRQVRLSYGVFHQSQELGLGLFRSPTFSEYAASHVNLCAQDTVYECLYWLVYPRKARLCQTRWCFWRKPVILSGNIWLDVINQVSFDRFAALIAEFIPPWIFIFCFCRALCVDIYISKTVVFAVCEAKIAGWINAKLSTYSFVRGHVITIVELIESWVSRQSTNVLDAS